MRSWILAPLAIVLLAADILLKALASFGFRMELIPRVLTFALVRNPALAFGIPVGLQLAVALHLTLFLIVTALAVSRLVLGVGRSYWLLLIAIAGGINLADRFVYGGVRDYLVFSFPFPIFNFADLAILIGILGLVGTFEFRKTTPAPARYVVPR